MKKVAHHQITGVLHNLSGMRIGGSDELLDIGATDLTIIKHPDTAAALRTWLVTEGQDAISAGIAIWG